METPLHLQQATAAPFSIPKQPPEEYAHLSSTAWIWMVALAANAVVRRYVGQKDWDYKFADGQAQSHDMAHHWQHLVVLDELLRWSVCAAWLYHYHTQNHHHAVLLPQQPTPMGTSTPWWQQKPNHVAAALAFVSALLFHFQDASFMTAYGHLPTLTFNFLYQLRLPAMAYVGTLPFVLHRSYTKQQWLALMGIVICCSVMWWEEDQMYTETEATVSKVWLGLVTITWMVGCNVAATLLLEWVLQQQHKYPATTTDTGHDPQLRFWLVAGAYSTMTMLLAVVKTLSSHDAEPTDTHYGFFYGFNVWTWGTLLGEALSDLLQLKVLEQSSAVVLFIGFRSVTVVAGLLTDVEVSQTFASSTSENYSLGVVLVATVVEFACIYAYGVPRYQWPFWNDSDDVAYHHHQSVPQYLPHQSPQVATLQMAQNATSQPVPTANIPPVPMAT